MSLGVPRELTRRDGSRSKSQSLRWVSKQKPKPEMGLEAVVVVDVEGDGGDRRWSVRRGLRVRSEMEGEDEGEGEIVDGG